MSRQVVKAQFFRKWNECVRLLTLAPDSELARFTGEAGQELQTALVCRIIGKICRTTGDDEVLEAAALDLANLVAAIVASDVLHTEAKSIRGDVANLSTILRFSMETANDTTHAAYERARDSITPVKTNCFNRCLTLFDAGLSVLKQRQAVAGHFTRDQGYVVMLQEMLRSITGLPYVGDCACYLSQVGEKPTLQCPDIQAVTKINKDLAAVLANSLDVFKKAHQEDLNKVKSFQRSLKDTIAKAFASGCTKEIDVLIAKSKGSSAPSIDELRPVSAMMLANMEALHPSMIAAVVLPQTLAKELDVVFETRQPGGKMVNDILEPACMFLTPSATLSLGDTCAESVLAWAKLYLRIVSESQVVFGALSQGAQEWLHSIAHKIAEAARASFTEQLGSFGPFICAFADGAAAFDTVFTKALVGDDPEPSVIASLARLQACGGNVLDVYLKMLPVESGHIKITVNGTDVVMTSMRVATVAFLALGKRIVHLSIARDGLGFSTQVSMLLQSQWQPAMAALKKVSMLCKSMKESAFAVDFQDHFTRQEEALSYCTGCLHNFLVSAFEAIFAEVRNVKDGCARVVADGTICCMRDKLACEAYAEAGALHAIRGEVMKVAVSEAAAELFTSFTTLSKMITTNAKAVQVAESVSVQFGEIKSIVRQAQSGLAAVVQCERAGVDGGRARYGQHDGVAGVVERALARGVEAGLDHQGPASHA